MQSTAARTYEGPGYTYSITTKVIEGHVRPAITKNWPEDSYFAGRPLEQLRKLHLAGVQKETRGNARDADGSICYFKLIMSDEVTSEQFPRGHSEQPLPTFCPIPRGVREAKMLMTGTEAVQTIEFFDGVGRKIGGVGNGGGSDHVITVKLEEDETIVGLAIVEHEPEGSRHYAKNLIFRTLKVHGQPPEGVHEPLLPAAEAAGAAEAEQKAKIDLIFAAADSMNADAVAAATEVERLVEAQASRSVRSSDNLMALGEMVRILKDELGLAGTEKEVVESAAEQVGIELKGPLVEIALGCMREIGCDPRKA
mmetsp:Transcript_4486/g.11855  ORF Transcript_4486/g.11855 Transcript_4486/m.11855 type:complete len:310 (+) Transcript_4486:146-1075(+)